MRKLLAIILVVVIMLAIVGCTYKMSDGSVTTDFYEAVIDSIGFDLLEERHASSISYNRLYIICDKNTKVMYYYIINREGMALCPYYDENGNISIYEGGEQ